MLNLSVHIFLFSLLMGSVTWTNTTHDLGAIALREPVEHVFHFHNNYDHPILVETVRTTCGCTVPEYDVEPVGPGEIGSIRIRYEGYRRGRFRKKIMVYFDVKKRAETLWIEGRVE